MARSIHVELTRPVEHGSLLAFLRGRGLAAGVVETNDHALLEVGYAENEDERLQRDVQDALRAWLAESELPLVPAAVGERDFVLRPPGE
jgi:hypothetical protein